MLPLFSLAFLFSLATSTNDAPNQLSSVVRDTDGRPLKSNTRYFIHSACWGEGGGGLLLLNLGDQEQNRCPTSVVQSLTDTYNGLGAYFKPKDPKQQEILESSPVNIKFNTRGYLCANWTVLKVDSYPKPAHNYTISAGAKLGNPLDENSWFQIKSLGGSAYKLVFCPHEVENCIDTGIGDLRGYRRLALAEDAWPFVFIKDDQYGKADE
ncbi:21 kDa seed protein-like [Lycium ferocissimum]|uniref:21 kDa seed protein-like n=1 Tax=Lycium ferocissimum TaxID=112874 RepID=UPI0028156A9E|nr:21 kDa seed protein-like [Lycium ferocissimum]